MKAWKDQFSIVERGKEDQVTDIIIKDKDGIIKRRIQVGFVAQQIEKYCVEGGLVWDPFCGCGSTGLAAIKANRRAIISDIGKAECELSNLRLSKIFNDTVEVQQVDILKSEAKDVDFVFTSPPLLDYDKSYSNVNKESGRAEELTSEQFNIWLDNAVQQIKLAMKPDTYAAIYSADIRMNKKVLPFGFIIMNAFMKHLSLVDIVIVDLRHDSRRKRRCVEIQENERKRHPLSHDYLFIYQKVN